MVARPRNQFFLESALAVSHMASAVTTGDTAYAVSVVWPSRGPSQFHSGSVSSL